MNETGSGKGPAVLEGEFQKADGRDLEVLAKMTEDITKAITGAQVEVAKAQLEVHRLWMPVARVAVWIAGLAVLGVLVLSGYALSMGNQAFAREIVTIIVVLVGGTGIGGALARMFSSGDR